MVHSTSHSCFNTKRTVLWTPTVSPVSLRSTRWVLQTQFWSKGTLCAACDGSVVVSLSKICIRFLFERPQPKMPAICQQIRNGCKYVLPWNVMNPLVQIHIKFNELISMQHRYCGATKFLYNRCCSVHSPAEIYVPTTDDDMDATCTKGEEKKPLGRCSVHFWYLVGYQWAKYFETPAAGHLLRLITDAKCCRRALLGILHSQPLGMGVLWREPLRWLKFPPIPRTIEQNFFVSKRPIASPAAANGSIVRVVV